MAQTIFIPEMPVVPPVSPLPNNVAAQAPSQGALSTTRIDSYDMARAFAVFGMLLVNYRSILLLWADPDALIIAIAEMLSGRAAALFIMLAGIGITFTARRALLSNDPILLHKVSVSIWKRCLFLYCTGLAFWQFWRADILHFYGLFLLIGTLALKMPARRLWGFIFLILASATYVHCLTEGDPDISPFFQGSGPISSALDNLFFSGYYSALPWLIFLFIGIWMGKQEVLGRQIPKKSLTLGALAIFLASELLLLWGSLIFPLETETIPALLLSRESFPLSPLSCVSAASGAVLVISLTGSACRSPLISRLLHPLKDVGRLSLTIYIGHIFLAYGVLALLPDQLTGDAYLTVVTIFSLASALFFALFAIIWCRYFERGPLEWLMRKISGLSFTRLLPRLLE